MSMACPAWLSGAVWPVLALSLLAPAGDQPRECWRCRELVSGGHHLMVITALVPARITSLALLRR
jgi:hypothetical protein